MGTSGPLGYPGKSRTHFQEQIVSSTLSRVNSQEFSCHENHLECINGQQEEPMGMCSLAQDSSPHT